MTARIKFSLRGVAILSIIAILIALAVGLAGVRVNTTRSIPVGLYLTRATPIAVGDYVIFCPPQNVLFAIAKKRGYIGAGFCAGGTGQMMKRVVALAGDHVAITRDGVYVNGRRLPLSTPYSNDANHRPLPSLSGLRLRLAQDDVFLMSDVSATSFDGRYFGPVNRSLIHHVIAPLVVVGGAVPIGTFASR